MMKRLTPALLVAAAVALAGGCAKSAGGGAEPASPGASDAPNAPSANDKPAAKPAAASQPGAAGHGGGGQAPGGPPGEGEGHAFLPPRPASDADYKADPDMFPKRLGIKRIFLQTDKINHARDPAFIPGTDELLVMAKVGGLPSLWRMPIDGSKPARMVFARPLYTGTEKADVVNRGNWYIGTPRVFPDGKWAVFDGTQFNPDAKYKNVLGLAPITDATGTVKAITVEDAEHARTPDVHPDGKKILLADCTKIREIDIAGMKTQTVTSRVVVELKRLDTNAKAVCTVNRPRYAPDGKLITFEVLGQFLHEDLKEKYKVPLPLNQGDYLIEPWIANVDGTGIRRLIKDTTYERDLRGRLQSGGSKEPSFFPDGKRVIFAHGRSMAVVTIDGEHGKLITAPVVSENRAVKFLESDPVVSADGKRAAMSSNILGTEDNPRPAPHGIAVIDLEAVGADEVK